MTIDCPNFPPFWVGRHSDQHLSPGVDVGLDTRRANSLDVQPEFM